MGMNRLINSIAAVMLMMVFVVGCTKPDEPNNVGNEGENDSIVDNGGTLNGHEFVDLGLPSGTLWATCNIGADTPEGYGDYFAWGETAPKEIYDWKSYRYGRFFNERYELKKYCTNPDFGLDGFVDSLTVLEPADDVALAQWGAGWRIPTIGEWEEMFQNTTSVWTTQMATASSCPLPAIGGKVSLTVPTSAFIGR